MQSGCRLFALLLTVAAIGVSMSAIAREPSFEALKAKAENGDPDAQLEVAGAYAAGRGTRRDSAQVVIWCRKAADQGLAAAQNCMGSLYQSGSGVPQDNSEAAKWYGKAAAQGDAEANTNLGYMYDGGLGVERDQRKAVELYRIGAEKGSLNGMLDLGLCYLNGEGVEPDLVEAYMWLDLVRFYTQRSSNMRLKWNARHELDELKKKMTPQQIDAAEARGSEWDKAHRPKSR